MNTFYTDDNGNSNVYIEKNPIHDLYSNIDKLLNGCFELMSTNIGIEKKLMIHDSYTLSLYINEYKNHLKDVNKSYENKKNIEAWSLSILLPNDFKYSKSKYNKQLSKVKIYKLINVVNNHIFNGIKYQYFAYIEYRGKQPFLTIVYFARYFYPEGKYILKYATSDWYYVPETGRRCTANDEQAVLRYTKGQVIRKEKIFVGNVIRVFCVPKEGFKLWIRSLKLEVANEFDNLFKIKRKTITKLFNKKTYKQLIRKGNNYLKINRSSDKQNYNDWYYIRKITAENSVRAYFNTISVNNKEIVNYYDEIKEMLNNAYKTHIRVNDFEEEMQQIIDYIRQLNSLDGSKNEAKKIKTNQVRIFNSPESYSHFRDGN